MTWEGYNYEDAVLLSEKLVQEDVLYLRSYQMNLKQTHVIQSLGRKKSHATFPTWARMR